MIRDNIQSIQNKAKIISQGKILVDVSEINWYNYINYFVRRIWGWIHYQSGSERKIHSL